MTIAQFALVLLFVGMMSGGQILFKMAAGSIKFVATWEFALALLANPFLLAGIFLYGAATVLWVFILQSVPISRAYPFVALSMVIVPAFGVLLFGESFSPSLIFGGVFVVIGILVITLL